jgi:hypothetical protein
MYKISQQLAYKERILFSFTFEQLLYTRFLIAALLRSLFFRLLPAILRR